MSETQTSYLTQRAFDEFHRRAGEFSHPNCPFEQGVWSCGEERNDGRQGVISSWTWAAFALPSSQFRWGADTSLPFQSSIN